MKQYILATACLLAFFGGVFAQQTKYLKVIDNARQCLENGIKLADNGKYEEAIAEFDKVPYGDAYYDNAQYEKSYALSLNKDDLGAIKILESLLMNPSCSVDKANIYTELANCYDNMKQYAKAIQMYDDALEKYPYNYHLYFNKGVSLMFQEKYEEARECFKKSIFLNPTHQSSHYQYAKSNLKLGYVVPGIMALNFCTLINPLGRYAIGSLQELQQIYDSGVDQYLADNDIIGEQKYILLDEFYKPTYKILNTDFIHTKQFHALSKIDNDVVKSNQLVFLNAKSREDSYEIEDQLYAPLLNSFMVDKQYNILSYYQLAGTNVDNNKVGAKAEKMAQKGDFNPIIQKIVSYLREACKKGLGFENKEGYEYIYDEQFKHLSWGKSSGESNGKPIREGLWYELSDNGQMESVANYKNDVLDGSATVYQDNEIAIEMNLKDNKLNGQSIQYTPDPYRHQKIKYQVVNSVNGLNEGPYQQYNRAGILVEEGTMENGLRIGEIRYYDDQGRLRSVGNLNSDGQPYGDQKAYYPDGTVQADYKVAGKNEKTPYVTYHSNGRVEMEGTLMNGNLVDVVKRFYPNGKLFSVEEYDNAGNLNGICKYYYRNGTISNILQYKDGNIESKIFYGNNGVPLQTYTYKNGNLTAVTALNPDSTVKETFGFKGKTITYNFYSEYGLLESVLTRDAKDQYQGEQKTYYPNGKLKKKYSAVDDKNEGECVEYYSDGKVKEYSNFSNNMRNGIFVSYYDNDANSIEQECLYRNDTLIGACYAYYQTGDVSKINLFDEYGNPIHSISYFPNGQKKFEIWYYNAMPFNIIHYDLNGEISHNDTVFNGNGTLNLYYPMGNVCQTFQLKGGMTYGESIEYDFNGKELSRDQNINGSYDGEVNFYTPAGEKSYKYQIKNGVKNGVETWYDVLTGNKSDEFYVEDGLIQGLMKGYTFTGTLTSEINMVDNKREGREVYYSPDGETMLLELYNDEEVVKYSCMQPGGKMSEPEFVDTDSLQITAYYPNGKKGTEFSFVDGLYSGNGAIYYSNGSLYKKFNFKDDQLTGQYLCYYKNGNLRSEEEYVDNVEHGTAKMYYENGKLARECTYCYGLLHGDYKIYDSTGKLIRKIVMFFDEPIEDTQY